MGAKTALKTYKLPIEPSQLKNFDDFHKKYGKYIVEAGNQIAGLEECKLRDIPCTFPNFLLDLSPKWQYNY